MVTHSLQNCNWCCWLRIEDIIYAGWVFFYVGQMSCIQRHYEQSHTMKDDWSGLQTSVIKFLQEQSGCTLDAGIGQCNYLLRRQSPPLPWMAPPLIANVHGYQISQPLSWEWWAFWGHWQAECMASSSTEWWHCSHERQPLYWLPAKSSTKK